MSTKANAKFENERKIFELFARSMEWPTDEGRIQSRPEPAPDILFKSAVGNIAFELVENCTQSIAHNTAQLRDGNGKTFQWVSDPSREVIKSKLEKNYTSAYPIELLIYTNGRLVTPDDVAIGAIKAVLQSSSNVPFRRVWYFGTDGIDPLIWEQST